MDDTGTRLTRVEGHVENLRTDVAGLRSDVGSLKTDMADVKSELRGINTRLDALVSGLPKWFIGTWIAIIAGFGGLYVMMDQLHTAWFHRYMDRSEQAAAEREAATRERLDRLRAETQANLLREQELYERREKERRAEDERRERERRAEDERRNAERLAEVERMRAENERMRKENDRRDVERREEFRALIERADAILSRTR